VNLFRGPEVKVTRPMNAHTVNKQYLPNAKAYKLQTWYTDGARRPTSATSAVTSKVKVARSLTHPVLADKSRTKCPKNTKIGRKVVHSTGTNAHQFQGQRSKVRSPCRLILRLEVHHIFRTGRPTNFKLGTQTEHEDPYHGQAP